MSASDTMVEVPASTDKFAAKLTRLLERTPNKSQIARDIGVRPQILRKYAEGSVPKPHVLKLLAEKLGVDLFWLIDEENESLDPPKLREATIGDIPDFHLFQEINLRYFFTAFALIDHIETVDGISAYDPAYWQNEALRIAYLMDIDEKAQAPLQMIEAFREASTKFHRFSRHFDQLFLPDNIHELLEDRGFTLEELKPKTIEQRIKDVEAESPGISFFTGILTVLLLATPNVTDEESLRHFFTKIAPYLVAKIATHWSVRGTDHTENLLPKLQELGYLDQQNKAVEMPDDLCWMPEPSAQKPPESK
ncbi:MAG: helix-turn-helix domain-containing protein [Planctomycetota bacterium]